jgi:group I intron endonuclease
VTCGIYKIKSSDGKRYWGSSETIEKRLKTHLRNLRSNKHYNAKLQRAYNKYGAENFTTEIVWVCLPEDLLWIEQNYLDMFPLEYNISGLANRIEHTLEVRAKLSNAGKGRTSPNKGKPMSTKARAAVDKYLDTIRGKPAWNKGKKMPVLSEEAKEKKREILNKARQIACELRKTRGHTPAEQAYYERLKENPPQWNIGIVRSNETRTKISISKKGGTPWNKGRKGWQRTDAQLKAVEARKARLPSEAEIADYKKRKGRPSSDKRVHL